MRGMSIIGHGIDIVEVARIARMLEEHGDRFTHRCFTEAERHYAEAGRNARAERYAARFATKEAVLKVLGTGLASGLSWQEMEVRREPTGRPLLQLTGRCAALARERGIAVWHMSVSHTAGLAVASVIGWG